MHNCVSRSEHSIEKGYFFAVVSEVYITVRVNGWDIAGQGMNTHVSVLALEQFLFTCRLREIT